MKKIFNCLFICLLMFNTVSAEEIQTDEIPEIQEVEEDLQEVEDNILEVKDQETEEQEEVKTGVVNTANFDDLKQSIDQISESINSIESKQQEEELRSSGDSETVSSYSYCSDNLYNYIPIDYIHFSGSNSYFVLDQTFNYNYTFSIGFRASSYSSKYLFGSYFYNSNDSNVGYYGVSLANASTSYVMFNNVWRQYSVSNTPSSFHEVYLNNSSFSQDGVQYTFSSRDIDLSDVVNPLNIPVGARSIRSIYDQFFVGDISYFKVYDETGALVADLVPVKRISDSIPGFFDKVSCKFYTSVGMITPIESHSHFAVNIFNTFVNLFQTLLTTTFSVELLEWFIIVLIFSFFIYLFSRS